MEEKTKFDYGKLKGRIVEKYDTQDKFSQETGINRSTISIKTSGKTEFTQSDILKFCDALDIPYDQIHSYFFTVKVEKTQQGGGDGNSV